MGEICESVQGTRLERVQRLLATLDLAEASIAKGEGLVITERSMIELADEVSVEVVRV